VKPQGETLVRQHLPKDLIEHISTQGMVGKPLSGLNFARAGMLKVWLVLGLSIEQDVW
jgi:hypothetical protein